ncbi:MAG: hypothetical protein AAFQ80_00175 [Cyanobacteria bacterium J06621_8]
MNNQSDFSNRIEQYLKLWIYFVPVAGVIPAIWTLSKAKGKSTLKISAQDRQPLDSPALRQQYKASRLAINLMILWLSSYILFSWGAANVSDLMSFRLMYANAITTTGYFLVCIFLLLQLGKKNYSLSDD